MLRAFENPDLVRSLGEEIVDANRVGGRSKTPRLLDFCECIPLDGVHRPRDRVREFAPVG